MAVAAKKEPRTSLNIRLGVTERAWFHEVARRRGITLSELARTLLAAEAAASGVMVPKVPAARSQEA